MIKPRPGCLSINVLGAAGGFPSRGVACSGFLLEEGSTSVLLDCGPGVAYRLLAGRGVESLDGVVVSHMHPDHMLDVVPLGYAVLTHWIEGGSTRRLPVWVPTGGRALLDRISKLFGHHRWVFGSEDHGPGYAALREATVGGDDWFSAVLDLTEYQPGASWSIGRVEVTTCAVPHNVPAASIRLDAQTGSVTYSGDSEWSDDLARLATGSDVFLCEAYFSGSGVPGGMHLTPAQAGELAERAGVGRLVLSHLGSVDDRPSAVFEARRTYGGPVTAAIDSERIGLS